MQNAPNSSLQGYASAPVGQVAQTRAPRHLERIASEADRVNRLSYVVQEFLDRFYGVSPDAADKAGTPIQVSYRSEIDRLSANLDTLDARVQALGEIG